MITDDKITGEYGTKQLNGAGTYTENFYMFDADEDTVISSILDVNGKEMIDELTNNKAESFMAGRLHSMGVKTASQITLDSGSVLIYKSK